MCKNQYHETETTMASSNGDIDYMHGNLGGFRRPPLSFIV